MKSSENNHHQKTITFDCGLSLQFIVLIENTADYIMKITAAILPEAMGPDPHKNNINNA